MAYRVIQWSTGNVGRLALRAIIGHPDLELVGLAERVVGVVDVVLRGGDEDAGLDEFAHARDAAAHGRLVQASVDDQADLRVGDDRHSRLPTQLDHPGGVVVVVCGEGAVVAGRDPAAVALLKRPQREVLEGSRRRVVGVVAEHVDRPVEPT